MFHSTSQFTRYLFADSTIGLTASRPILNRSTGEIIAIAAVDYTLTSMSASIAETTQNRYDEESHVVYDDWKAWIFEVFPIC